MFDEFNFTSFSPRKYDTKTFKKVGSAEKYILVTLFLDFLGNLCYNGIEYIKYEGEQYGKTD